MNENRIILILGPTAGGKSDLAVALAQRFDGEIISADSMQVYLELDAGTAKPSPDQRAAAPHHLIDVVDPTETWTVAEWLDEAERLIDEIQGRGKMPIVVGGTNLYVKALLEGLLDGPPPDEDFRDAVAEVPPQRLHDRLKEVDPPAAERIHPNDRKRIVRALEVYSQTGQRISDLQTQWKEERAKGYRHNPIILGLRWPTEAINRRINARVKQMFSPARDSHLDEGLVEETRRLRDAERLGPTAREALGTKQCLLHLAGVYSKDQAMEQVKIETRRFAKQQRTWLKRFRGVHWLEPDENEWQAIIDEAADHVRTALEISE